jgi:hypothetical protein
MKIRYFIVAGSALALSLSACDVEQTEKTELPEVEVKGGNMPEFDVDAVDVDVKTEKRTIEVPVVDVEKADAGAKGPN